MGSWRARFARDAGSARRVSRWFRATAARRLRTRLASGTSPGPWTADGPVEPPVDRYQRQLTGEPPIGLPIRPFRRSAGGRGGPIDRQAPLHRSTGCANGPPRGPTWVRAEGSCRRLDHGRPTTPRGTPGRRSGTPTGATGSDSRTARLCRVSLSSRITSVAAGVALLRTEPSEERLHVIRAGFGFDHDRDAGGESVDDGIHAPKIPGERDRNLQQHAQLGRESGPEPIEQCQVSAVANRRAVRVEAEVRSESEIGREDGHTHERQLANGRGLDAADHRVRHANAPAKLAPAETGAQARETKLTADPLSRLEIELHRSLPQGLARRHTCDRAKADCTETCQALDEDLRRDRRRVGTGSRTGVPCGPRRGPVDRQTAPAATADC